MAGDGGVLTRDQADRAQRVCEMASTAITAWEARDLVDPEGVHEHPSYALAGLDGEDLAYGLAMAATATAAATLLGAAPMVFDHTAAIADLLLTEVVARLTGGGGPGA